MPRLCLLALPVVLRAGALAVFVAASAASALAESSSALLRPEFYGDPKSPSRFQKAGGARDALAQQPSTSTFQPPSAAGRTGFDSSGKRKSKAKDSKAAEKAKAAPLPAPPSRYGTPVANPHAPTMLAVQRPILGVARRGASPYYVAPEPPPDTLLPRLRPLPEETPFDPIGVQVGAFNFRPAIELSGGYDTNPSRTGGTPTPSWFSTVAPELKFNSNWSRHAFAGDIRGTYYAYENLPSQNRPALDSRLIGRVDVTGDSRIDLETKYLIGTDSPGSPNIQAGLAKLPIFQTFGGTVGVGHRFNRFDISAKGGAERTVYQDSTFTDGSTASNEDRNYNRFSTVLRGSYEVSPGVRPFVEVGADRRVHDLEADSFGYQRNSIGGYGKAGTTFELTRILTGEVALGWLERHFEDPRLEKIAGLGFDASLTWLVSALTIARLSAVTRADESTVPGVSGVLTREVALQVDHAFRRWLVATGKLLYGNDNYVGSDRIDNRYAASAAIIYKLNRNLWLKSEYRHEWLRSSVSGVNYDADVILLTLRAQR